MAVNSHLKFEYLNPRRNSYEQLPEGITVLVSTGIEKYPPGYDCSTCFASSQALSFSFRR